MATTKLGDTTVNTSGEVPAAGSPAPDFKLTGADLGDVVRSPEGRTVLNIFPSVDTGVCAASVREFNRRAAELDGTTVICASMDLPFALARFCGAEGIENVVAASGFRSDFGTTYGVAISDSKMQGLYARAVVVIDADGTVLYSQLSPAIAEEPDYDAAIAALG